MPPSFIHITKKPSPILSRLSKTLLVVIGFGSITILSTVCGGSEPTNESKAEQHLRLGIRFQEQGEPSRAGDAFTLALMANPRLAEAWARRAWVFYVHQNLDRALEDLDIATDIDPKLAIAHNYRGLVYFSLGEKNMASLSFGKAISLDSNLSEAYHNRANLRIAAEDLESAIEDLSSVIRLNPNTPKYRMERARILIMTQNTDRAAADLEKVLAITQDESLAMRAKEMLNTLNNSR